jgi:hypothetical protein
MKMTLSHVVVLVVAVVAGVILGAMNPSWASTITLGAVKTG